MSTAELINYWKELIETWNIDSWQCEVEHLARIITLNYFIAKLSPLDQYFNSVNFAFIGETSVFDAVYENNLSSYSSYSSYNLFVQSRTQKLLEGID